MSDKKNSVKDGFIAGELEKNIDNEIDKKEHKKNVKDNEMANLRDYVLEAINEKDDNSNDAENLNQENVDDKKNSNKKIQQKASVLLSGVKKISNFKPNHIKGDDKVASDLLKTQKTSLTKKVLKYFLIVLLVVILFIFLLGVGIYYFKWENKFFDFIIEKTPLPIAIVGNDFVLYNDYNVVLAASLNSLDKESEVEKTTEMIDEVKTNILNRLIDIKMTESLANEYNVFLTDEEISNSLNNYIKEAGSEDEFKKILNDLYLWTLDDFKEKLLKPFLLENKLNNYLAWSDDFNQDKKSKAEKILSEISPDISENGFIELVKQYSEDYSTIQNGGYLDSFGRGSMVKEFEDVAFSLPVGGVSGVVRTVYGFHIIMITSKNDENGTIAARHILIKARNLNDALEDRRNQISVTKLVK